MEDLRGKRLLLLGGTTWKNAISDFAKDNGITIIAAGNNPNAKFFEIADETYIVNSTDADAMKKLIREKKIDGVHMGGNETVVTAAVKYLHELNLPCYCNLEQWAAIQNKISFKNLCVSVGLPVVPQIKIEENNLETCAKKLDYPVITKPVDGAGSKGFSVCRNAEEFLTGYDKAKKNSTSGGVMVEKFVNNSSAYPFYTFSEGKIFFSGFTKRYVIRCPLQGSYILGIILFKSPYTEEFRQIFEDKLIKLFEKLNLREGNIFMEVFHDGKNYYFNEAGYRYPGTMAFYPINYFYGINQLHSDIYYSLTGESCISGHRSLIPKNFPRKKHYAIYAVHLKAGTIAKISGVTELNQRENILIAGESKSVGDTVENDGTFAQIFALIHFVFDTKEEFIETVDYIHEKIIVDDAAGNNLVNRVLDVENVTSDFFESHKLLGNNDEKSCSFTI